MKKKGTVLLRYLAWAPMRIEPLFRIASLGYELGIRTTL